MTVQTILKAAQAAGLAHNSGAGGEFILVGTGKQLEALERSFIGDGGYVPGVMRCDRCRFELTRVSLNVNVGTATAGDSEPEPCPNWCGPLRPTTWKERSADAERAVETWCERAIAAEKIADLAMFELLDSEAYRHTGRMTMPRESDRGFKDVREAIDWLRPRGYVELVTEEAGEFIRVLKRPEGV